MITVLADCYVGVTLARHPTCFDYGTGVQLSGLPLSQVYAVIKDCALLLLLLLCCAFSGS